MRPVRGQMVVQETFGGKLAERDAGHCTGYPGSCAGDAGEEQLPVISTSTMRRSVRNAHRAGLWRKPVGMAITPDWAENLPLRADKYDALTIKNHEITVEN